MKSWIRYIFLSAAAWGALLTSCNNVLDEEGITACDDKTATVHLTISFGGDEGPMSRDVTPGQDGAVPGLDYTTEEQCALDLGDIFVLAFEEVMNNGTTTRTLVDIVKELKLTKVDNSYYTWTIDGSMPQQGANKTIRFVVLTNLIQNGIVINTNNALDSKDAVEGFLNSQKGKTDTDIYDQLIYNYDGQTPWTITARRIPMWGISESVFLNQRYITMDQMFLYRAVAKVQIWVNKKKGIDGFKINSIKVNNINNQGYCVSKEIPDDDDIDTQYTAASVPDGVDQINSVTYDGEAITNNTTGNTLYCSDMIYLPEQINTGDDVTPATITVNCTYNYYNNGVKTSIDAERTIEFRDTDTGDRFDIIRNHSYIFNIYVEETDAKLYYTVTDMDIKDITIPPFE